MRLPAMVRRACFWAWLSRWAYASATLTGNQTCSQEGESEDQVRLLQLHSQRPCNTGKGKGKSGIAWYCPVCLAWQWGGYVAAYPICLGLSLETKEPIEAACQDLFRSIGTVGGACVTESCPMCSGNSDCAQTDQWCCGAAPFGNCVPGLCYDRRPNGAWCNEDAACEGGHCNAIWDTGPSFKCDKKRDCDDNNQCDQSITFCCGLGNTLAEGCKLRRCAEKRMNNQNCNENAECWSGHCCYVFEGGDCSRNHGGGGYGTCRNSKTECTVSIWSDWDPCSASCGGGTRMRKRVQVTPPQKTDIPCPNFEDSQPCNEEACPTTTTTTTTHCPDGYDCVECSEESMSATQLIVNSSTQRLRPAPIVKFSKCCIKKSFNFVLGRCVGHQVHAGWRDFSDRAECLCGKQNGGVDPVGQWGCTCSGPAAAGGSPMICQGKPLGMVSDDLQSYDCNIGCCKDVSLGTVKRCYAARCVPLDAM